MTTGEPSRGGKRLGPLLQQVAFFLLLACVAVRGFLAEFPFRTSDVRAALARQSAGETGEWVAADRSELARVSFAVGILLAGCVWATGGVLRGGQAVRAGALAVATAAFACWSLASALLASDKRSAMDSWLEQVSLMAAGWLAVQLCADRRRFATLVIVLAGLAGAMAVKGTWQIAFEVPERVQDFEMHRTERLAQIGWEPGTPQAKLIELRMRDWSPFGYFALANPFGSLLLVLGGAAVALAGEKLATAIRGYRERAVRRKRGELDLPTIAAAITTAVAAAALGILVLTRSRGAIGAGVLAAIGALVAWLLRRRLRPRWKTSAAVAVCGFALAAGAVVAYGLATDSLPTRTMTFRWYYWSASARIVRDRPLLGVGAGNFPAAYLHYRRAAAEEEVKMPHNALVQAATEYGLPGGALYVLVLGSFVVLACRPGPADGDPAKPGKPPGAQWWVLALAVPVVLARWYFAGLSGPFVLFLDGVIPACILAGCLALAAWRPGGQDRFTGLAAYALPAAVVAFALHNMVTISLWMPATALAFYVTAGACVGRSAKATRLPAAAWRVITAGALASVIAAGVVLWRPVAEKTAFADEMVRTLARGDVAAAAVPAGRAAEADVLDPRAAAEAARLLSAMARSSPERARECLPEAFRRALEAIRRDPADPDNHRLAAQTAMTIAHAGVAGPTLADALSHMAAAVERNANDARLRVAFARMLVEAGKDADALRQLDAAERIQDELLPGSVEEFNADEREEIERLKAQARRRRPDLQG